MNEAPLKIEGEVAELPEIIRTAGKPLPPGEKPPTDKASIIDALHMVVDPDVNIDVVDLVLIYNIETARNGDGEIEMTLTSPTCPMAEEMVENVAKAAAGAAGAGVARARLTWEPAWNMSMLSEDAKYQLEIGDLEI